MLLSLLGVLTVVLFSVCLVKSKMPLFILSARIFIALLTFPFFIFCENLLDISVMFVDV